MEFGSRDCAGSSISISIRKSISKSMKEYEYKKSTVRSQERLSGFEYANESRH